MQTLLMILLLSVAVPVAYYDGRELFLVWYSVTSPSVSFRQLLLTSLELILCLLTAGVVGMRLCCGT